ncbi:4-hydroxythreonine-4-phosphate dehydrogenase PdxA [Alicyclobacillus tolerans]|uniref:4-hydroxythreonine-4-phosphate dehydrogenase PdxA n=1 Tax=Alicyclobacillus tolerans TaxID=90970 RepID=UPI001F00B9D5|nr:4-hydroxythreonine-4-phosphate dehydrogenase PdxA [Alicyclobacillus tolerans]MCF8568053.1 4-hydroxythreonine-4-phosphate dehydrogenase PdxA [Alicyclobacillus tolerans]
MAKPTIAITMGDPAGIGPEISLLSAVDSSVTEQVNLLIVGDLKRLKQAADVLHQKGRLSEVPQFNAIEDVKEARFHKGTVDVVDLNNVPENLPWGKIDAIAGKSAFEFVEAAVKLANRKEIDAIATAPIHKEAWKLAGVPYPGHTEALAALSGAQSSAMMLVNKGLRVVHVTTHVSLKKAIDMATKERVLQRILLTNSSLKQFGIQSPKLAVAGINPHAGEAGLFGDEESLEIQPALEEAKQQSVDVSGPYPPDSIYFRAASGEFDAVIAQYHDQGHIAIKMLGFDTGINVTLGLPILRTSVDHGTAFDIAGKGIARERSMIEAIEVAKQFLQG